VHLNGIGPLSQSVRTSSSVSPQSSSSPKKKGANIHGSRSPGKRIKESSSKTHELKREVNCCAGGAGRPSASVTGRNSNIASMFAIANHSMSDAKNWPEQTRRPNPNTTSGSGNSADVAGSKKRSGLNFNGSGYVAESCRIALQLPNARLRNILPLKSDERCLDIPYVREDQ
jgi:hypothetical protein